jgi:hypothetical protein
MLSNVDHVHLFCMIKFFSELIVRLLRWAPPMSALLNSLCNGHCLNWLAPFFVAFLMRRRMWHLAYGAHSPSHVWDGLWSAEMGQTSFLPLHTFSPFRFAALSHGWEGRSSLPNLGVAECHSQGLGMSAWQQVAYMLTMVLAAEQIFFRRRGRQHGMRCQTNV